MIKSRVHLLQAVTFFLVLYFFICRYHTYCCQYLSVVCFFFSSRRRHTRYWRDWSSDVCSSDLLLDVGRPVVDRAFAPRLEGLLFRGIEIDLRGHPQQERPLGPDDGPRQLVAHVGDRKSVV